MSDCSSCTRPPSLAIVAAMLNTYKILVAASEIKIWLVPRLYMPQYLSLRVLKPVLPTPGDAYHNICMRKSQSRQQHDVLFRGLARQMPWLTMEIYPSGT